MNWLEKLKPPKLYRYIFYRLSIISARIGNTQPYFSAMLLMTITVLFQFFFVVLGIGTIFKIDIWGGVITGSHPFSIIVFMLAFIYTNYLIFYYKDKWKQFMEEFKNEDTSKRKRRGWLVLVYILVSFSLFFLNGWLIVLNSPHY